MFCREDGSPSWGRKLPLFSLSYFSTIVEKMGPLRGDGNKFSPRIDVILSPVEKMGPLRGDGNAGLAVA